MAILGLGANHFDKVLNARTQAALQKNLDTSIGNEGRMEGKLGFISDTVGKFNCPGAQEFAAAIRQAIPPQKSQPSGVASTLQSVMPPAFQYRLSSINKQLRDTWDEYYQQELNRSSTGSFEKSEEAKEKIRQTNREELKPIHEKFVSDYKQLIQNADQLRKDMVDSLPPGSETAEDREQAVTFFNATQGKFDGFTPAIKPLEYLHRLYERLPADKKG